MRIPKVESLIITVFFLCIALWGISKCASKRSQLVRPAAESVETAEPEATATRPTAEPGTDAPPTTPKTGLPQLQNPPPAAATEPAPAATTSNTPPGAIPKLSNETPAAAAPVPAAKSTAPTLSKLFVTINNLKVRKEPNLKSEVVTRLKIEEQVFFMNKKSEKPEKINLGYETVTDYWVKIRTKSGQEGWVFGAGVHYYRMKRKGVME